VANGRKTPLRNAKLTKTILADRWANLFQEAVKISDFNHFAIALRYAAPGREGEYLRLPIAPAPVRTLRIIKKSFAELYGTEMRCQTATAGIDAVSVGKSSSQEWP